MGTAFFAIRKRKTGKQPEKKEKKNIQIVPTRQFVFPLYPGVPFPAA